MIKIKLYSIFILVMVFISGGILAQTEQGAASVVEDIYHDKDSTRFIQTYDNLPVVQNFKGKYRIALRKVRKVYPLALRAAELMDSLDMVMEETPRRGKQKKAARQTSKELKEDFKFLIKDLYISEGQILTKLIYRETGLTVKDIIKTYKNGFEASFYSSMGKLFEQDLEATYNPETDPEDFILECVILDIQNGVVEFDDSVPTMDRAEFKEKKKEARQNKRKNKKKAKAVKKQLKQTSNQENTAQKIAEP